MDALRASQRASNFAHMSPGCCAQQLVTEGMLCYALACKPGATDTGLRCVKGLTACELAAAMEPGSWWEVSLNPSYSPCVSENQISNFELCVLEDIATSCGIRARAVAQCMVCVICSFWLLCCALRSGPALPFLAPTCPQRPASHQLALNALLRTNLPSIPCLATACPDC